MVVVLNINLYCLKDTTSCQFNGSNPMGLLKFISSFEYLVTELDYAMILLRIESHNSILFLFFQLQRLFQHIVVNYITNQQNKHFTTN